jgi:hypothetical protein
MVLRTLIQRDSAHVQRREDFLLLHELGQTKLSQTRYQSLIQELPGLNEAQLSGDLQRTGLLVDANKVDLGNLVWKYHISVRNELKKRAERRGTGLIQEPPAS